MSCVMEVSLNKIENSNPLMQDIQKIMPNNQAESKNDNDEGKVPIVELFPWITEFQTMCKCILENQTMASLTELMQYYIRNVSISVNECCTKPLKASRLKESMSESLLLFLYIYRTLSGEQDKHIYLSYMSDILAKYIDMELKASKRSSEERGKICARLISCFYIFLGHSTEYLLNTLMKIQLLSSNYLDILHPIISKIMKLAPAHPESNVMYVCYFLIYSLWRKLNSDTAVKNEITTLAINSLGPPPVSFCPPTLEEVLPKVPKSQSYCTKSLLQQKFDVKRSCELFIELCKEDRRNMVGSGKEPTRIESQLPGDNASCTNSKFLIDNNSSVALGKNNQDSVLPLSKSESGNLNHQTNIKPLGTISNNLSRSSATPKSNKSSKAISKRKSKMSHEIVVIDLTSDEVSENIIKRKKNKKLAWLEEVKKRVTLKTAKTSLKIKELNLCENENMISQEDGTNSSHHTEEPLLLNPMCIMTELKNVNTSVISHSKNTNDKQSTESEFTDKSNMDFVNQAISNTNTLADDDCGTSNKDSCISSSLAITTKSESDSDSSEKSVLPTIRVHNSNKKNCTSENIDLIHSNSENVNNTDHAFTVIKTIVEEDASVDVRLHIDPVNAKNESDRKTDLPEVMVSLPSSEIIVNRNQESQEIILHSSQTDISKIVDENMSKLQLNVEKDSAQIYNVHTKAASVQKTNEDNLSCIAINEYVHQEIIEFEETTEVRDNNSVNSSFTLSIMTDDHPNTQTDLEVNNYATGVNCMTQNVITNDGQKQSNTVENTNVEEYNTLEQIQAVSRSTGEVESEQDDIRTYDSRTDPVKHVSYDNIERNCDENFTREDNLIHTPFVNHSSPESIAETGVLKETCSSVHVVHNNDYIIHDTELHGNIDGLSLLASVSQHVPHLKADTKSTHNQIKVKDYAFIGKAPSQEVEVSDVKDTFDNVSHLCENPTPDVINRIVGIYPEETLDEIALHVEVPSTSQLEHGNVKDESSNTVLRGVNSTVEYDTHVLTNNLISMENSIQPAKENTNVILNGETVVLLQKSPNSNLYIINKAVENSKEDINDLETCGLKEKAWLHLPTEDSSSVEANRADQNVLNFDVPHYNKEFLGQACKYSVGRTKGIKVEPEEAEEEKGITNYVDTKAYVKKNSLLTDSVISTAHHRYQDINITPVTLDKRKVSAKSNLSYGQGVKEEYINHITSNCGIQAYQAVHPHQQSMIEAQHPLHVPASHSNNIPSIYNNCPTTADLCVPYHKHCTSVSCNVQMNGTNSLRQHSQSSNGCGRTHCSCLDCAYDIVTHCRQYLHPSTETHMSCIDNKSYFLSAHSSVQTSAVQEHEKTSSGTAISKIYDDQLLCKIEENLLKVNPLENIDPKCDSEKLMNKDLNNKLPLKKRLKAHAMMTMVYEKLPKKTTNSSYPGMPMMSIAALEALDNIKESHAAKSHFESSGEKKDLTFESRHFNSNIIRDDYYKDVYTSSATCSNIEQNLKKHDSQYHSAQTSGGSTTYSQMYHQKTFKTPAQRKQGSVSELSSLKRINVESPVHEIPSKKAKKPSSPSRQTRSSKRNVPKVNYSCTDIDPEWNPSGEAKRKRKKTSR